jgi:hypothetical protein
MVADDETGLHLEKQVLSATGVTFKSWVFSLLNRANYFRSSRGASFCFTLPTKVEAREYACAPAGFEWTHALRHPPRKALTLDIPSQRRGTFLLSSFETKI